MQTKAILSALIIIAVAAGIFGMRASLSPRAGSEASADFSSISVPERFKVLAPSPSTARPGLGSTSIGSTRTREASLASTSQSAEGTTSPTSAGAAQAEASTDGAKSAVCNESAFGSDGYSPSKMIDIETCKKLNALYASGKAAGNAGDLYDNRDGLHVNFCVGWTPAPDCPPEHRLFPQHDWRIGSGGRATSVSPQPTIGQASYSGSTEGSVKHGIPYAMYRSQSGTEAFYRLYRGNNLYIYPSLSDDSFAGDPYDKGLLEDPSEVDQATANIANTPYVIGSKQICDCGAGSLRIHDASGSDLAFVELGFAGLAAFRPDVKKALAAKGMLIPTLQAMIRYSHYSVDSDDGYLRSELSHGSSYLAHRLEGGSVRPAYDASKLVDSINGLALSDVPPLVELSVASETFDDAEALFETPGAVARRLDVGGNRSIALRATALSADGRETGYEYKYVVLSQGPAEARISERGASATVEFRYEEGEGRTDVAVFARRSGGKLWSVPAIISLYTGS
ncbi:MAG: hypothetical protein HZA81_03810 [Candidatus Taylorbacteria bacterium]|nr:hypothetical protein [Candidatus Taylorbacteria bacterium]